MNKKTYLFLSLVILIAGLIAPSTSPARAQENDDDDGVATSTEDTRDREERRGNRDDQNRNRLLQDRAREQREAVFNGQPTLGATTTERQAEKDRRQAEREIRLSDKREQKLKTFTDRMIGKIEAAFTRIDRLAGRLNNRLDIFDGRGADASESRALLVEATTLISAGRASLDQAKIKINELLLADIVDREKFAEIKTIIKAVVDQAKTAHRKVVEAITKARGAVEKTEAENQNDDDGVATSTSDNTGATTTSDNVQ